MPCMGSFSGHSRKVGILQNKVLKFRKIKYSDKKMGGAGFNFTSSSIAFSTTLHHHIRRLGTSPSN